MHSTTARPKLPLRASVVSVCARRFSTSDTVRAKAVQTDGTCLTLAAVRILVRKHSMLPASVCLDGQCDGQGR